LFTLAAIMPESKRRKPKSLGPTPSKHVAASEKEPSPQWYVALMAGLMAAGVVLVLIRFVFQTDQWLLLVGLVMISAGFIMTTNYR
jgi:1,4-dihydroxy-2-naphthoate octaprenyltransferase